MKATVTVPLDLDFALLKKQKAWILEHKTPEAEGILDLIDAIQDHAVDVEGLPETEVFNLTEE